MGMRGNIRVDQPMTPQCPVYLYTHWRGHQVNEILAQAIAKAGGRCSDPSYFTRIIFQEMVGDDKTTESFGISVRMPDDNEYPIPRVFWQDNHLQIELDGEVTHGRDWIERFLPIEAA